MSLATRQQMALLSVIGGSLFRMRKDNMFSVVAMKELVDTTYLQVIDTMREWPRTGDDNKSMTWISKRIDAWKLFLDTVSDFNRLIVLACVCNRCLTDVQSQINSRYKRLQLEKLEEPLNKIHDFMDPDCCNFVAYAKADELMDELYTLIEWEWKK